MTQNKNDKSNVVFTYLSNLSAGKALLHTVTLLSIAIILRFGFGDFKYVEDRINKEVARYRIIDQYESLKERVLVQYGYVLEKWGGEFVVFMYFHDYYPMAIRFNALSKSYGLVVPSLGDLKNLERRAEGLLTDLPVIYDDELITLLRDECYYTADTDGFYLADIFSILGIEEFVSFPVHGTSDEMVGYISIAFPNDRNFNQEQIEELCLDMKRVAEFTSNTSEFVEIFGDIKRNGHIK
jgi:hypothetical protein